MERLRTRVSDQQERKRRAILQQAAKIFDERGYHETSLVDIAQRLHVTKPTLYYYVRGRSRASKRVPRARAIAARAV